MNDSEKEIINKELDNYLNNIYKNIRLDYYQKKAVICDSKNQMIVAGAGSGKTTTMAAKVKYLVEIKKIDPNKILVLSYTNKAVQELQEIINIEFNIPVTVTTFHKLGMSIIKNKLRDLDSQKVNIIDDENKVKILTNFLKEKDIAEMAKYLNEYLKIPNLVRYLGKYNEYLKYKKINYSKLLEILAYDDCNIDKSNKGKYFLQLKNDVYYSYYKYKKENNMIDFDDMINLAINYINENKYKYIIVDEYQDISLERYNLLNNLSKTANLIVVGDDWQSIYAFAGSKVELFNNFILREGTEIIKIVQTYRNSQELINVAGMFIMKDKQHMVKELISPKRISKPIKIVFYDKRTFASKLNKILARISLKERVLILGRFSFDYRIFVDNKNFFIEGDRVISKKYPQLNITFLTVHAAKGLGYDQVIIVNMKKGIYGFPSLKENPKFLNIKKDELEERRLFYVALTRTKNYVYLMTPYLNFSPYVDEIIKDKNIEILYL